MGQVVNKTNSFFAYANEKVEVPRSDTWFLNMYTFFMIIYLFEKYIP
jgi:hypothetical protein